MHSEAHESHHMFRAANIVLVNKMGLAPHLDFDPAACRAAFGAVKPKAAILFVSACTGMGFDRCLAYRRGLRPN